MTLPIGPSRERQKQAFTLVELILVLVLLVVAVSMVAPRMAGFIHGRALDSEARRLIALSHAGQSRAVSEGVPVVLWVDEKGGTIGLQAETQSTDGDAKMENLTVAENLQIAIVNTGGRALTTFRNKPAIRFLADGSIDENSPRTLQLTDVEGNHLWMAEMKNRMGYEIRNTID